MGKNKFQVDHKSKCVKVNNKAPRIKQETILNIHKTPQSQKKKLAASRRWQPTPVLLPGKSHGWRSLVSCSPWGCEELDTTE